MMRRRAATWCLLLLAALAACSSGGGLGAPDAGSSLPPGPTIDAGPLAVGDVFGFDEVVVSPAEGDQSQPVAAWNGSDYLVAWIDGNDRVRAARLGTDGSTRDPAPLTLARSNDARSPALACGASACAISWLDLTASASGNGWSVTRVALDGTPIDATPLVIADGEGALGATADGFMVLSGDAGALRVTRLGASGAPLDDAPLLLFSDPAGTLAPEARLGCDADACLVAFATCTTAETCVAHTVLVGKDGTVAPPRTLPLAGRPTAVAAGAGGFLVTGWETDLNVVALRVDAAGAAVDAAPLPVLGAGSGFEGRYSGTAVAFDGDAFVVAARAADGLSRVFARRIDPEGGLEPGRLEPGTSYAEPDHPLGLGCGPGQCLVAFTGSATFRNQDVIVTRLAGTIVVEPQERLFTVSANGQDHPAVASDGTGYLVVWEDVRAEGATLRAARLSAAGAWLDATSILPLDSVSGDDTAAVAWSGSAYQLVWTNRNGAYAARIGVDGTVRGADRVASAGDISNSPSPRLSCGGGVCYVAALAGGSSQLWRLAPDGLSFDPTPIGVPDASGGAGISGLAFRDGVFVVTFDTVGGSPGAAAALVRVAVDGTLLDPAPVALAGATGGFDVVPVATADDFVVTWTGDLGPSPDGVDLGFAVLDGEGRALAHGTLATSAADERRAAPVFDGANVLVPWVEGDASGVGRVMMRRVHPSGALLEVAPVPVVQGAPATGPVTASTGHGDALVVWDAFDATPGREATRLGLRLVHE